MNLGVLVACHNRRELTLACLRCLRAAALEAGAHCTVYLFDDGSTDGTADAVLSEFPEVKLLRGDGQHFWNRAMHAVFAEALNHGHDAYLWLNDDTMMRADALCVMLSTGEQGRVRYGRDAIAVGAVADPDTGELSYGGARRVNPAWRPFLATVCKPDGTAQRIDTFNGNLVLVPNSVALTLGNLDPSFEHAMGDTDYSLRAASAGVPSLLTPSYVAHCRRNSAKNTYRDAALPWRSRMSHALSRRGMPWRSWLRICRRHGGRLWMLHFVWAYTRIALGRG